MLKAKLPQVFIIKPQAEGNYPFLPSSFFWRSVFPQQEGRRGRRGEKDYGVEEITKIKPIMALVATFDKFHHLCNLYSFGFCFVVP